MGDTERAYLDEKEEEHERAWIETLTSVECSDIEDGRILFDALT